MLCPRINRDRFPTIYYATNVGAIFPVWFSILLTEIPFPVQHVTLYTGTVAYIEICKWQQTSKSAWRARLVSCCNSSVKLLHTHGWTYIRAMLNSAGWVGDVIIRNALWKTSVLEQFQYFVFCKSLYLAELSSHCSNTMDLPTYTKHITMLLGLLKIKCYKNCIVRISAQANKVIH